ncbi:hypothetical protein N9995_00155 [bacterium]|nr:hypothetical protein [bacterium]
MIDIPIISLTSKIRSSGKRRNQLLATHVELIQKVSTKAHPQLKQNPNGSGVNCFRGD